MSGKNRRLRGAGYQSLLFKLQQRTLKDKYVVTSKARANTYNFPDDLNICELARVQTLLQEGRYDTANTHLKSMAHKLKKSSTLEKIYHDLCLAKVMADDKQAHDILTQNLEEAGKERLANYYGSEITKSFKLANACRQNLMSGQASFIASMQQGKFSTKTEQYMDHVIPSAMESRQMSLITKLVESDLLSPEAIRKLLNLFSKSVQLVFFSMNRLLYPEKQPECVRIGAQGFYPEEFLYVPSFINFKSNVSLKITPDNSLDITPNT